MTLSQNQCQPERTHMLTVLMLAMQNRRIAVHRLTGNMSMFLDNDGSVAWLYHCPKISPPLKVLDTYYDRITIFFERTTKFVDPVTHETYDSASEIPRWGDYTNVCQLHPENDNSWYQLLLDPMACKKPLFFKPTELGHITQFAIFNTRRAGIHTSKQTKKFWDNVIRASASETVQKKLPRTILTQNIKVWTFNPRNIERLLNLDDGLLMDHLLTPSFFVDKFKEIFSLLGYYIQSCGNFLACFFLVKFLVDVVVIVLLEHGNRKVPAATFGFDRTMLGAIFHLFVLSLQTSMYETDENKNNGTPRMQNITRNETLAAPMYEESSTSLYPHVHIVTNPIPISPNKTESQGKDSNVFQSSGIALLNSNVSAHEKAPSTSSTFLITSIKENAPSTSIIFLNNSIKGNVPISSDNRSAPNCNGNAPKPPP